ncbi:MAG: DNA-3-methyladenine glycosylase I [Acidimicrobiales bacterium]
MQAYHDDEWGVPVHDDRRLFELIVLEGAQAGLSWSTILNKRDRYRQVFAGFDPEVVAGFDAGDVDRLLADPGIVRNRAKVTATIANARATVALQAREGSLDDLLWSFVGGCPTRNNWTSAADVPASTEASATMSRELRRRGFRFLGPTICYALMQSAGGRRSPSRLLPPCIPLSGRSGRHPALRPLEVICPRRGSVAAHLCRAARWPEHGRCGAGGYAAARRRTRGGPGASPAPPRW